MAFSKFGMGSSVFFQLAKDEKQITMYPNLAAKSIHLAIPVTNISGEVLTCHLQSNTLLKSKVITSTMDLDDFTLATGSHQVILKSLTLLVQARFFKV